jgi:hypothetical protein
MGCGPIPNIWVHRVVEWVGEKFAFGIETGMDGNNE